MLNGLKVQIIIGMKILIKNVGFIGDNLFALSLAPKLRDQFGATVDYVLSIHQPLELYNNDPYVNKVFLFECPNEKEYDKVISLRPINRQETPCIQFQNQCDIKYPSSNFHVYTNKSYGQYIDWVFESYQDKIKVAILSNWEERSFLFTEEQYKAGIDVPNLGYGGAHRNISYIYNELSKNQNLMLIPVGKGNNYNQREIDLNAIAEYSLTASLIKGCDYFIGAEGGLANLAAGVGTKTILTSDFVHQLYGWNGVIEKNEIPKLGPSHYFETGHIDLDPYLTDEEVVEQLNNLLV